MKILQQLLGGLSTRKRRIPKTDITRRFDLITRVGQGSMSKVWRARDYTSGRIVALKVLDKKKTEQYEARFPGLNKPTEGEIAVQLKHPHIVRTHEFGWTFDEEQFLVMDFIEGVGLSFLIEMQNDQMQRNRLSYMVQLGEAIEYFHRQGWIHRDICPRNVLIDQDNQVKLIDFGLVVPNTPAFQKPGNRTGTVTHMAPELIKRLKTDQRIDIFSYAFTCFEMYTGQMPWERGDTFETVLQRINTPPEDIRTLVPDIDPAVAEAIMQGLQTRPEERWSSVTQMLAPLRDAARRAEGLGEVEPHQSA